MSKSLAYKRLVRLLYVMTREERSRYDVRVTEANIVKPLERLAVAERVLADSMRSMQLVPVAEIVQHP